MAKRRSDDSESPPAKVTVFFTTVEGTDASVQGVLQAFAGAFGMMAKQPGGTIASQPRPVLGLSQFPISPVEAVVDPLAEPLELQPADSPRAKTRTVARRSPRAPEVIEMDLDSAPSLQSFLSEFANSAVVSRYLVIAYWMSEHRSIREFTIRHIHTCMRRLGWQTPSVAGQALVDLKNKSQLLTSSKQGVYSLNHNGEYEAKRMLGIVK